MKKLISLLIVVLLGITTFAQERTVALNNSKKWDLDRHGVRLVYTGTADDTLKDTNQDTIAFTMQIGARQPGPLHFYLNINSKGLTATDTTFTIESDYKISTRDTYAELVADKTSAVNTVAGINTIATTYGVLAEQTTTQTVASYTVTTLLDTTALWPNQAALGDTLLYSGTNTVAQQTYSISSVATQALYYRYMRFMLIIAGNDASGTGIEIEELEIIFDY